METIAPNPDRLARHRHRYVEVDTGFETPCWVWRLCKTRAGYARVASGVGSVLAHRVLYEEKFGAIPQGLCLDHLCRVRACVNPDHLEPVTLAENIRRGSVAKLTKDDVRAIRRAEGSHASVAKAFGVSAGHVSRIRGGHCWQDV